MTKDAVKEFFDEWRVYDQVLEHNYMFHQEIYQDVQRALADIYGDRSFTLLDLGCGGARHLATALSGRSVARYVGFDLSDVALLHAKQNLGGLGCAIDLRQGDFLVGLRTTAERFDLIFCSFALHHLSARGC